MAVVAVVTVIAIVTAVIVGAIVTVVAVLTVVARGASAYYEKSCETEMPIPQLQR